MKPYWERVRELRVEHGFSREELARLSKLTASYIYRIERGQVATPSYQTLNALAQALQTSVPVLVDFESESERETRQERADLIAHVAESVSIQLPPDVLDRMIELLSSMNEPQIERLLEYAEFLQQRQIEKIKKHKDDTLRRNRVG